MGGNAMLAGGQLPSATMNRAQTSDQAALVQKGHLLHEKGALVPWFQPMSAHIRSCWAGKQAQAAVSSAASLVEGRWRTPKRLFQCGMAESPLCELCGGIGDLPHRLASCPAREAFRTAECPKWLSDMAMKCPSNPCSRSESLRARRLRRRHRGWSTTSARLPQTAPW